MARLDKTYTFDQENLIAAPYPQLIVGSYKLAAGQGVVKRGSLMEIKEGDAGGVVKRGSLMEIKEGDAGTLVDAAITAGNPVFVVADDVDTTDGAAGCVGYRSGHFFTDGLITKDYRLTKADLEKLRQFNIYTSTGMPGEEA